MTFIPEIVLPERTRRKSRFSKNFSGQSWNYFAYTGMVTGICLALFVGLFITAYDPSNPDGSWMGMLAISLTIFIPSMVGFFMSSTRSSQLASILSANRSILQELPTLPIPNSVIVASARAQLKEYDPNGAKARAFSYGFSGQLSDGKYFSMGQLANIGPYAGYGSVIIQIPPFSGNIIIDAGKDERMRSQFNFRQRLNKQYRYDLEGPFVDKFDIYAPSPDHMQVAAYILTPDVMQKILEVMPQSVDIEIVDSTIIIAWPEPDLKGNNPDWHGFVERASIILNTLGESLYQRTNAYISHTELTASYVKLTPRGAVLSALESFKAARRNWFRSTYVVMVLAFFGSILVMAIIVAIVKVYIL